MLQTMRCIFIQTTQKNNPTVKVRLKYKGEFITEYNLTKDGKKALGSIYAYYLKKIDDGQDENQAKLFDDLEYLHKEYFDDRSPDNKSYRNMLSSIYELKEVFGIKVYTLGNFILNNEIVAYMEELTWNTFLNGIDLASKVKSILKLLF